MMVHQPESAATLVALQSVSQCYPGRQGMVKVLDEVSLSVCQGDFIAITGESGSGKSTLLNIIGLLMPPSSGVVNYQGRPVSFGRGAEVAQRAAGRPIGFVFQQFNLIPSLSVLDNVALPLLYQGLAPAARAAQSLAVLETLGIADKAGQRPDDLSGGQKQRVAIARALVAQPALMIADEPTGSLDPRHADEVMTLLCELNQAGMALVMVTHDLVLAARAKSRWRIAAGRIVHD